MKKRCGEPIPRSRRFRAQGLVVTSGFMYIHINMENTPSFESLGLSPVVLEALKQKGFEEPTPIQAQVIPALLSGDRDLIGQAQTGTGKTAAFGLPLIEKLISKAGYVQALVLTPTRELAMQVTEEIASLRGKKELQIAPVYGGQSITEQLRRLSRGVDLVVGTPGRIIDHLERRSLNLDAVKFIILDEADEMLDMGFQEDIEKILQACPEQKRMLLFSATMPDRIKTLSQKYLKNAQVLKVESVQLTTHLTDQIYFEVTAQDRLEALCRIMDVEDDFYGMVFCRTKVQVDDLVHHLIERGYDAEAIHGDLAQNQREIVLKKFKSKRINILVATDVAARGIDIPDLSHVINYSLPQDPEAYVHRIGRTGRAGKEGTAITFITPEEFRKLTYIQKASRSPLTKMRIPGIEEVIALKTERIQAKVTALLEEPVSKPYQDLASKLLEKASSDQLTAVLLAQAWPDELETESYAPIRDLFDQKKNLSRDRIPTERLKDVGGKTRLFVALGKRDGFSPRRLVELLEVEGHLPGRFVDDVAVMENFSFVTVPFKDAERLVHLFRRRGRFGKPLITVAEDSPGGDAPAPVRKPRNYKTKDSKKP